MRRRYGAGAVHIGARGVRKEFGDIVAVEFERHDTRFPMVTSYDGDQLLWGHSLDAQLRNNQIDEDKAIYGAKLVLYDSHQTADMVKMTNSQLERAGKSLVDLFSDHLSAVYAHIVNYVKEKTKLGKTHDIDSIEKELRINVPAMWNPNSCKILMAAVKKAELPKTMLVYEPICTAAFTLHALLSPSHQSLVSLDVSKLEAGDIMQVADCGGGTADFALYELVKKPSEDGATVGLRMVSVPTGELAGSGFVTKNFQDWLSTDDCETIRQQGGVENAALSLDLTEYALKAKAARDFNVEKARHPWSDPSVITVSGKNGKHLIIEVPASTMEASSNRWWIASFTT